MGRTNGNMKGKTAGYSLMIVIEISGSRKMDVMSKMKSNKGGDTRNGLEPNDEEAQLDGLCPVGFLGFILRSPPHHRRQIRFLDSDFNFYRRILS